MQKDEATILTTNPKATKIPKPRKKNDEFLKGIFKDNFPDFLRFVYPDANEIIDFSKNIDFMDKELFAIIPDRERKREGREADLLAKLHLLDGTEKWMIVQKNFWQIAIPLL